MSDVADLSPPLPMSAPAPVSHTQSRWTGLAGCERWLGVVFCGVVLLNFVSAAGRYLGGHALLGADEVQVYTMVWLLFLGAALAAVCGVHLRMDVLSMRLPPRLAAWRQHFEALLTLAVCAGMAWVSFDFMRQILAMEQRSDAAGIPMWIPHLSAAVGFAAMALQAAWQLINAARRTAR